MKLSTLLAVLGLTVSGTVVLATDSDSCFKTPCTDPNQFCNEFGSCVPKSEGSNVVNCNPDGSCPPG